MTYFYNIIYLLLISIFIFQRAEQAVLGSEGVLAVHDEAFFSIDYENAEV